MRYMRLLARFYKNRNISKVKNITHLKFNTKMLLLSAAIMLGNIAFARVYTETAPIVSINDYSQNIRAAEAGDARAAGIIADCYLTGIGVRPDINEAWKWYARAASKGDAESRYRLAILYRDGKGVKQNFKESAYWFRAAAKNGHPLAMLNLGDCYYEGRGVQGDYRIAAENFWRASDKGVPEAAYRLGLMLRDGIGIPQDKPKALKYFRQAAMAQYADAAFLAAELERQGVREPMTPAPRVKKGPQPVKPKDVKKTPGPKGKKKTQVKNRKRH